MKKTKKRFLIGGAVVAGLALAWWWHKRRVAAASSSAVRAAAQAGLASEPARLSPLLELARRYQAQRNAQGPDPGAPATDAAASCEVLARVIASEAGERCAHAQTLVAWCARNRAQAEGTALAALLPEPWGPRAGRRRLFATTYDPRHEHRQLAASVLVGTADDDPTLGATHCLSPARAEHRFAVGASRLDLADVRRALLAKHDYYGSAHGWDLFGPRGGRGAQPPPAAWLAPDDELAAPADELPAAPTVTGGLHA